MPVNDVGFGRVNAGVWTRIYSGPAIHVPAVFSVNFRTVPRGAAAYFVTFTWDLYSAVVPFYDRRTGLVATAFTETDIFAPSIRIGPYTSTPWADVLILVSRTVDAKTW